MIENCNVAQYGKIGHDILYRRYLRQFMVSHHSDTRGSFNL